MKAFSLANAPHLPVTGASHPLVRESMRWLTTGNAVALLSAMILFGSWYAWSQLHPEEPPVLNFPGVVVIEEIDFPPPPPIVNDPVPDRSSDPQDTPSELADPDPVPDSEAPDSEFPTLDDVRDLFDGPGIDGPIDVSDTPSELSPQEPFALAFDEYPELLSIDAPVYPELARQAGLEGTVKVKVYVTRTGKVKYAVAVEGPEVFWNAAIAAAKTALFTPARQGDTPVDVWVIIPVTFSLNR
jgi:protein TonB